MSLPVAVKLAFDLCLSKAILLLFCLAVPLSLQAQSTPDRGTGQGPQQVTDLDNISLQNGSVSMDIPLASLPPMAGGKLGYTLTAHYNSNQWNVWRSENEGDVNGGLGCPEIWTSGLLAQTTVYPWTIGAGYEIIFKDAYYDDFSFVVPESLDCGGYEYYYMQGRFFRPVLKTPDGGEHEMRIDGSYSTYGGSRSYLSGYYQQSGTTPNQPAFSSPTRFYTVDGTYFTAIVNPSSYSTKWTVYAKDGTKVEKTATTQTITDTNANSIEFGVDATYGYSYAKDLHTGRLIKWSAVTYNGNPATQVQYQSTGGSWQSVYVTWGTTTVQGKAYSTTTWDSYLETACTVDQIIWESQFNVIREIEFPNTESGVSAPKYTFAYNSDSSSSVALSSPQWSCSGTEGPWYRTVSYGWGQVSSVTTPSGAVVSYEYASDGQHDFRASDEASSTGGALHDQKITEKNITHDGVTDTWQYGIDLSVAGGPSGATVTAPDGSTTTDKYYPTDANYPWLTGTDGQGGLVYKSFRPGGILVEKHWTLLGGTSLYAFGSVTNKVKYNAVVDTEYTTLLDTDGTTRLKMTAKTFTYDYNGDPTSTTEYDWINLGSVSYTNSNNSATGIPTGIPGGTAILRVSNNSYYNTASSSSSSTAYHKRTLSGSTMILGKPSETTVGTSSTTKSDTKFSYDGNSWGTVPSVGNLTKVSAYNDTTSSWIDTTSTYDSRGNVATTTDGNGNTTSITYGSIGGYYSLYPTQTVQAYGTGVARTTQSAYDFYTGLVTSVTDYDNSVTTTTAYDIRLRPTIVKNAYGTSLENWVQTEYHDHDRFIVAKADIISAGDGKKVATQFFDQLGRARLSKTLENASTQSATNETDGIKVETKYAYASGYTYHLTSNPFRASSSSSAGGEETMGWTRTKTWANGRQSQVETFSGTSMPAPWGSNTTSTGVIDKIMAAETTTLTDQAGKLRRSIKDSLARVARVDEPNNSNQLGTIGSPNQATYYYYDVLDKLIRVNQGSQDRYFMYNSMGRIVRVFQPEQEVNTGLNTSGNPDNNSWTMGLTYDSNGSVLTTTDAKGTTITKTYDALNRPLTRSYSDGTPTVTNYYDGNGLPSTPAYSRGQLTRVSSSVSDTRYTGFDRLGRLTQTSQITGGTTYTSSYTYNLTAPTQTTYPSGRIVQMDFTNGGDISKIYGTPYGGTEKTYAETFSYTADKKIKQLKLGNGLWETAAFNPRLQVTEFDLGTTAGAYNTWRAIYDYGELQTGGSVDTTKNSGNIAKQTISFSGLANPFVQVYKYDSLDRITEAKETVNGTQTWIQNWGYDRYGSRNSFTQNVLGNTTVSAPTTNTSTNRYSSSQGYTFDKNGNVAADPTGGGRTFVFDGDNKQTQIKDSSNNVIGTYSYDGEGRRITKVTAAETTTFVYGSGQLLEERNSSGALTTSYVYAGTQLLAAETSTNTNYTATDQLGSPRVITNSAGSIVARRDFLPFGEELFADGTYRKTSDGYTTGGSDTVRQRFTGYQRDLESGFDFAEARYYDNSHGRFTAVDPMLASGKSANPQTFNRYVYVMNCPTRLTDPTGLQSGACPAGVPGSGCGDGPIRVFTIWIRTLNNYLRYEGGYNEADQLPAGTQYRERYTAKGPIPEFVRPSEPVGRSVEQFNETMKNVDETVQKVPIVGSLYNSQKAAMQADTGQGSGANAMLQTGLFGVDLFTTVFTGGTTNVAKGTSVIGPRASYRQFAKELGANFLDVADEAWTWAKNESFLKGIVSRGDDVVFAGKFNPAKLDPKSVLAQEINYLIEQGYRWNDDFTKLIKAN